MAEIFSGYSIEFGFSTAQTLDMTQIDSMETSINSTHTPVIPAGAITPAAYLTPNVKPEGSFTTQDLDSFFTDVDPMSGLLCDEPTTFMLAKRAQGGGGLEAASATTHVKWTAELGQLFPESISATADSESGAVLTARFIPLTDGTLAPLVFAGGIAIDTYPAPSFLSSFFLASPYHNSVEIPGVRSINIDFGATYKTAANTPDTYDDCVVKTTQTPVFRFTLAKASEFAAQAIVGETVNTSFAFYLQRADTTNGGRVAPGSSTHFKISCTAGKIVKSSVSFDGNEDGDIEIMVHPVGAVAISLASTIGG